MQIGEVIQKYRKMKNITQSEMANRLGVTAPAVNKWENGNSMPDITLLAPIARLLGVTLDTLLSFQEELTGEEINDIVYEVDLKFKEQTYEEVFLWAKEKIAQYPNCDNLIWQLAVILDAQRMVQEIPDMERYDEYICSCYMQALNSADENIRHSAADSLFGFYMRKENYEKAEMYLAYFSKQNPERKRKLAELYSKTNRINEAYQTYEELLFSYYGMTNMAFYGLHMLALKENDREKVRILTQKRTELSRLFDMGEYYEYGGRLEIAALEKDVEATIAAMQGILSSVESINSFQKSPLYEHMTFKELNDDFVAEIKSNLRKSFQDEETYGFLENDKRWWSLTKS